MITRTADDATLGQRAYHEIRHQILEGTLEPGRRLSLRAMATALGMSIAPVGEAFRELARDGLIEIESRWGTRVRRLDIDGIRSQHILRTAVECEAIRHCTVRANAGHIDELDGIACELDARVQAQDDPESVFAFDARFHQRLAQCSGVVILAETLRVNQLVLLLARGSRIAHGMANPPRWHQALVDAIRTGNPDTAEAMMRTHCVHSMNVQLEYFTQLAERAASGTPAR